MSNTRMTLWMDRDKLKGSDRYSSKNPKFRVWMMLISIIVVVVALIVFFFCMPKTSSRDVYFSSIPDGAVVYVDGEEIGTTPFTKSLKDGDYQIRAEISGYVPEEKKIEVSPANTSISIVFEGGESKIIFTSVPDEVSVFAEGRFIGKTPFVFRGLDTSKPTTLKLEKYGYSPLEIIEDLSGKTEFKIKLEQILHNVVIDSDPQGAELFIDGQHLGQTPWVSRIGYGLHTIKIAKDGGYEIIEEEIEIKSDLEIIYPLDNQGVRIHGTIGGTHIPGAKVFVLPVYDGRISEDAIPLILSDTTPTQIELNTLSTYLTMTGTTPENALFIGLRDGVSASMMLVDVNSVGEIEETEINLQFPPHSQIEYLGQPLTGIDWFTLLSEEPEAMGGIMNNPRFILKDGNLINRDNPEKSFNIGNSDGEIIVSTDLQNAAVITEDIVKLFSLSASTVEFPGNSAVFSYDNRFFFVLDDDKLTRHEIETGENKTIKLNSNPNEIVCISDWVIVSNTNVQPTIIGNESFKITDWNILFGEENHNWAIHFIPESIFTRNIIGVDHVFILGKVLGLEVLVAVDTETELLNVWFDTLPQTIEQLEPALYN